MKLVEATIHRAGPLANRRIGPFEPGLNVLFGPNEAGKTTLFRFVRRTLHADSPNDEVTAAAGRRSAGFLVVEADGTAHRLERLADETGSRLVSEPLLPRPISLGALAGFLDPFEAGTTTALLEAAAACGIELTGPVWRAGEVGSLRAGLEDARREAAGLVASLRERCRLLANRVVEAERDRDGAERAAGLRSSLLERRDTTRQALEAARAERSQLERERAALIAESDRNARDRARRAGETPRQLDEWLRGIGELDERLERLRLVLADLDRRALDLQHEIERHAQPLAPADDVPRAIRDLEAEVRQLQADRASPDCDGGHESSCRDAAPERLDSLRQAAYRLCDLVGRREAEARIAAAREELRELEATRRGLRARQAMLSAERSAAACRLAASDSFRLLVRSPAAAEFCHCDWHREFVEELRRRLPEQRWGEVASPEEPTSDETSIAAIDARLAESIERIAIHEHELARFECEAAAFEIPAAPDDDECARRQLQSDFARLDLRRAVERYRAIRENIRLAEEVAERGSARSPNVVAEASAYLGRLVQGHFTELRIDEHGRIEVLSATRGWTAHDALGAGTRHLVGLALRLAIGDELARRGTPVPLLLDDVLVDNDLDRQRAAVELLAEWAAAGRQIVLLTCHLHLREACRSRGAHVLELPPRPGGPGSGKAPRATAPRPARLPRPPLPPDLKQPTPAARPLMESPAGAQAIHPRRPVPARPNARPPVVAMPAPTAPAEADVFTLSLGDDVRRLPRMNRRSARRLGLAGVRTIGELLAIDLDDKAPLLAGHGIGRDLLEEWLAHARLMATIPDLPAIEAAALVEIGVHDGDELRGLGDDEIEPRLARLRETPAGRGLLQSGRRFDAAWLAGVRERAAGARPLDVAGTEAPRPRRSRRQRGDWSSRSPGRSAFDRTGRPRLVSETASDATDASADEPARDPRFLLSRSSAVVDAPAIGPKTAERLLRIGVRTVDDLLELDPDTAALRLGNRHITADTIRDWQAQAQLVCRIPELRGHDAQILVACGIDTPERIAEFEPAELLATVTPFCRSAAGLRVLRSGSPPGLGEVTNWIRWSRMSRALRAA